MPSVVFEVGGEVYVLPEDQALGLATHLVSLADSEHATRASRQVAREIEDVIVGATNARIPLNGDRADAVYRVLDFTLAFTSDRPTVSLALHRATRPGHPGGGRGPTSA